MRSFDSVRRVVVKIGTNVLSRGDAMDTDYIEGIGRQVHGLRSRGYEVVLVTSGAIGMGARELGLSAKVTNVQMRQACAAIGQPLLMHAYKQAFQAHGLSVAQVLLTSEVLNNRRSYLNLRNAIESLLSLGVVPIVNENDSVSTAEIGTSFGDNDRLSALVASKLDAELLIMLTDIEGLYDRDPRRESDARLISEVETITPEIERSAAGAGSAHATGGMRTKLKAAGIAAAAGCRTVLVHGRERNVLERVITGETIGTVFGAKPRMKNRLRWLRNSEPRGRIVVDDGALRAIRKRNSLLVSGVREIEGVFPSGAVVMINDAAKVVTNLDSAQLQAVAGKKSAEVQQMLGEEFSGIVARPEDTVFLDE